MKMASRKQANTLADERLKPALTKRREIEDILDRRKLARELASYEL